VNCNRYTVARLLRFKSFSFSRVALVAIENGVSPEL
jgi:hypothetical protein